MFNSWAPGKKRRERLDDDEVQRVSTPENTKRLHKLGGGLNYFLFSSLLGEMIQFDDRIFQRGC